MDEKLKIIFECVEDSLNDEFDYLAGMDPIWIVNWISGKKYKLKPRKRIILSPNTKDQLIDWASSDAASSNCLSLEGYAHGTATEKEMLEYAKELVDAIEYEHDNEILAELIYSAKYNLDGVELIIKDL